MNLLRFASIEIGSNAVRMIIGQLKNSRELHVLERWSIHLRLGDVVFESGKISEQKIQQLQIAVKLLLEETERFKQIRISLSATSAMRDAANQDEVVSRLESSILHPVNILSGSEELCSLLEGIKAIMPAKMRKNYPLRQTILVDLGGGSLEISLLESKNNLNNDSYFRHSFDIGTLRLHKINNPVQELESSLQQKLGPLLNVCKSELQEGSNLILTGGNAKTFARIFLQMTQATSTDEKKQFVTENWLSLDWSEYLLSEQILSKQTPAEQTAQWKLGSQQVEVFNLALAVFRIIGCELKTTKVSFPFFGLKEALLLRMASLEVNKAMAEIKMFMITGPPKKHKI
ncbi:MAG: hypothetical protein H8E38_13960 [SAR324 cluster bacterium]|nr:hypothetical protein [SAR324 cluster bacterium]MBL7035633.1 hypothetical protein [SAR324 cluster bacterium]